MFIVKDLNKLKNYGFTNTIKDTYVRCIALENNVELSLLVNPFNVPHYKNEIVVYVNSSEFEDDVDFTGSLDILSELIEDGVVKIKIKKAIDK